MFILKWAPVLTSAQLLQAANPQSASQPEAIPWILYDSQTYTSAATTTLSLFAAVNADKTLSNMESSGQLPDPQFHVVHYVTCDMLIVPAAVAGHTGAAAGVLSDIDLLLKGTGRGTFTFVMSNKNYGPFPLMACHSLGGATGVMAGTLTAEAMISQGNNGIPGGGGFPFLGSLVIPPKVGFGVTLNWATAQTMGGGNPIIRIGLPGILYRRVV